MSSDKHTTPTINGLRLVSPEEAGYKDVDIGGADVAAVLLRNGLVHGYLSPLASSIQSASYLQELPKPRTTRPYRRGEVKCGDVFRHKERCWDKMVVFVGDEAIDLGWDNISYQTLFDKWHKLTYDSEGREVLECAGKVEEQ